MKGPPGRLTPTDLWERLAPRDREVATALISYHWLGEREIAPLIGMAFNNFHKRCPKIYGLLQINSRASLLFIYREYVVSETDGGPTSPPPPNGEPQASGPK